jgi:hypothetical protein
VLKNIFKRGYEEIRDRKLLEILKKGGMAQIRIRAPSKYVNKLAIGFYFFIPEVKQQDSTPQNDSSLGFKWITKIAQNIV